jgi:anti-sigma regulatory factor (Ser/Thr protein kinase)
MTEAFCSRAGLPAALTFKAQVVLEELFVNIFLHAYQNKPGQAVITLQEKAGALFLRVDDQGPAFDPLARQAPDLQKRFEEGLPGGAGLVLLRSMAEDLRYTRRDDRNILELRVKE